MKRRTVILDMQFNPSRMGRLVADAPHSSGADRTGWLCDDHTLANGMPIDPGFVRWLARFSATAAVGMLDEHRGGLDGGAAVSLWDNAMEASTPMYLEDLAAGQTFRSGTITVDRQSIVAFAAEFDPQPFHLDESAATGSLFGRLVASGWHTAALTMRLLVSGGFQVAGGLIGMGVESVRWPRPVYPGDVLHVESEVLEVRTSQSNPARGVVKIRNTTVNQDGQPVMIQIASLTVPCRPESHSS